MTCERSLILLILIYSTSGSHLEKWLSCLLGFRLLSCELVRFNFLVNQRLSNNYLSLTPHPYCFFPWCILAVPQASHFFCSDCEFEWLPPSELVQLTVNCWHKLHLSSRNQSSFLLVPILLQAFLFLKKKAYGKLICKVLRGFGII